MTKETDKSWGDLGALGLLGHEIEGGAGLEPLDLVLVEAVLELNLEGLAALLGDLSLQVPVGESLIRELGEK